MLVQIITLKAALSFNETNNWDLIKYLFGEKTMEFFYRFQI